MDFKVGQLWKSRNGKFFTIMFVNQGNKFPVTALDEKSRMIRFDKDGFFINKEFPHENDLVEYT
jgi:hypothetical protein